jgi:hypothetical protein
MTRTHFLEVLEEGRLDDQYNKYLMKHTDTMIGDGDMLMMATKSSDYNGGFGGWFLSRESETKTEAADSLRKSRVEEA